MDIDQSDVLKVYDVLDRAVEFHRLRDEMNAQLHLAKQVRYSPLTNELINQRNRLHELLELKVDEVPFD